MPRAVAPIHINNNLMNGIMVSLATRKEAVRFANRSEK
jgi:hypothetical protein